MNDEPPTMNLVGWTASGESRAMKQGLRNLEVEDYSTLACQWVPNFKIFYDTMRDSKIAARGSESDG
jgi:hypothetical protein